MAESEDELETLKTLMNNKEVYYFKDVFDNRVRPTVGKLLDLYQKEKEKNSKIQKYVRSKEWAEDYEKSSCRTKILRILEE